MTTFLGWAFRRLPIGWLQLIHNRMRLSAAIAGVAFANILIFMQLGFLGALIESIRFPYDQMNADVLLMSSDSNTLADGSPLPRQRMYQALAVKGVADASAVFYGVIEWKQPDGTIRGLVVFGVDPSGNVFRPLETNDALTQIALPDFALIDRKTRNVPPEVFAPIDAGTPYRFEANNRTLTVSRTFEIGGGFSTDGYLIVSDQTFLRLFPKRRSGAPNFIFVTLKPDFDTGTVIDNLKTILPNSDTVVRTIDEAVAKDQAYQTTQKPVGIIFGFGVVMGALVGVIIVYQVLSTDVADHLREYATFKAMGYTQGFFLGIVFEEALILALFGFVPGSLISAGLYEIVSAATGLPIAMTAWRLLIVLVGTLVMCTISGAIATRRLANAEPADLF